jgi:hypothetical protein
MSRAAWIALAAAGACVVGLGACSNRREAATAPPRDAAIDAPPAAVREPAPFDPSGVHLDDDVPDHRAPRQTGVRPAHPIDIILRSTPPGAMAAVDGVQLGRTPRYWQGDANGREHEFTFTMKGYAFARYRFVPITGGVVHARLTVITDEPADGEPPDLVSVPVPAAPVAPTAPPLAPAIDAVPFVPAVATDAPPADATGPTGPTGATGTTGLGPQP